MQLCVLLCVQEVTVKGARYRRVGRGFLIAVMVAILLACLVAAVYFTRRRYLRRRL